METHAADTLASHGAAVPSGDVSNQSANNAPSKLEQGVADLSLGDGKQQQQRAVVANGVDSKDAEEGEEETTDEGDDEEEDQHGEGEDNEGFSGEEEYESDGIEIKLTYKLLLLSSINNIFFLF